MRASIFFLAVLSIAIPRLSPAGTIYVDVDATGANNGTSWANAFTDLDAAFGATIAGDQMWVAAGVYKPNTTGRHADFDLPNIVALYGGFTGTETQLNQRDWVLNETILSGDIGIPGDASDNSYHVVYATNVAASTRLDGFKITGGRADDWYISVEFGGGLYIENSSLTVANCTFIANHASERGGGIYHEGSGSLNIINCKIYNNTSVVDGGGIYFDGTQINIFGSDISNNQATSFGGGIYLEHGAAIFDRCIFSGNMGSIAVIYRFNATAVNIYNSLFAGNYATSSLLSANSGSSNELWNCTFADNQITNTTGTVVGTFSSIRNCIFWGNDSPSQIASSSTVSYCLVQGGFSGSSNISTVNPLFIQQGNSAFAPFDFIASGNNYRLPSTSPAINAGNNTFVSSIYNHDLDDSTRVSGFLVDLGCYERYVCTASASISAGGPTAFCDGGSVTLTASLGSSYSWSNGTTVQNLTATTSGTYSVTVIDTSGCWGIASETVTAHPASVQITGSNSFCSGQSIVLNAVSTNGNNFVWSTGATGQNLTVTQAGTYTVTVTTANNCTAVSSPKTVTQVQTVTPSVSVSASETSICDGNVVQFTATTVNGGSPTYLWKKNGTSTNFTGNPYVTQYLEDGDVITVEMTSNMQCASPATVTSSPINMSVTSVNTPVITRSGNIITSSEPNGNQWYISGTLIPGETGQTITIQQNGNYVAFVTINGCSSSLSNVINVTSVGVEHNPQVEASIFPNPVDDLLSIKSEIGRMEHVCIYSATGVLMKSMNAETNFVDVRDLADGFYILEIKFEDAIVRYKFAKT